MEYFNTLVLFLILKPWEASSITTRIDHHQPVRNFRRHTDPSPFTDWELGLRESVHQALLREHYTDPSLRDQLLEAPFIGRRNIASPFGDIAVLGRGQLYYTSEGFKFVQDEEDDCTDCHDARCVRSPQCQLWKSVGHHHKLLALWTVKRIRHRDPHYGHVFEIEYTVSPTSTVSEEIVRRQGYFNYNIPGHIFVIKSDPRLNSAYYLNGNNDKWYKKQAQGQSHDYQRGHFKPGILIGVTPDGYKQVLHSFPGFYSSYHPQDQYNDHTTIDPKEYELYKKLIESLASKTSNVPHRFSITTPTEKTTATTPTYLTTFVPVPQTTFVRVVGGQFVSVPENTIQPTTTRLVKPQTTTKFSEPDLFYHTLPTTPPPKPITTIHYYTPVEVPSKTSTSTATTPRKVIATTSKSTKTPSPVEEIDTFDIFTTPVKKTTRFSTTPKKTTQAASTQPEQLDLFPINTSTEPMQPVTEAPEKSSPDSINEQLPPPEENVDTTVPYVSSTVTEPATQKVTTVTKPQTTQRLTTVYVPSEIVPYTEERTTVVLPIPTQEERVTTPIGREKITTEKIYTLRSTIPTTFTSTTKGTTLTETVPSQIYSVTTTPNGTTLLTETVPVEIYTVTATIPNAATSTPRGTTLVETVPAKVYTVTATIPTEATQKGTTLVETVPAKIYTLPAQTFTTTEHETTSTKRVPTIPETTIFEKGTTQGFTISSEAVPLTHSSSTTQKTTQPTTIFEYTFDSTIKGQTESTINTLPATTTNLFSSTEPTKFTIPITASHYFYTMESEVPKTSTITTQGTTTKFDRPSTNLIKESAFNEDIFPTLAASAKTTETQKVVQVSTTTEDFLADLDDRKTNRITDTKKDFDEDDIFGEAVTKSSIKVPEMTTKQVLQSDIAKALFGTRRSKRIKVSSKITRTPVANTTRIIYGNFYAPSTLIPTSTGSTYETTTLESADELKPSTDQSFSTSVSFEVNKRNKTRAKSAEPRKADKNHRAKKEEYDMIATETTTSETKKVFDHVALQLVNHARSIDYLEQKPTRQPKYKRRSFATRRKSPRKSSNSDKNKN